MIFNPTYLIGKHFQIEYKYNNEMCCMCGNENPCIDRKDVIKSTFMDHEYLDSSKYICVYCAACVGYQMSSSDALRSTSFLATETEFKKLKKFEIWEYIEFPPHVPYVLAVTFSNKKHIAFKALISPGENRFISTDKGNVVIDFNQKLVGILKNWYRIINDTKQEPTAFTKNDILFGCQNFKKIESYGDVKYFNENSFLNTYRGTDSLNLLVYLLNKQPMEK